jgi:site-specific recombinase XerD
VVIQLQRVQLPDSSRPTWTVIGDDYLPLPPVQDYLRYLHNLERSPNTIRTYARALKFYWEFLQAAQIDWLEVSLENLADFIHWLRCPEPGVIPIQPQVSQRTEKTINLMLTAVCGFYEFHERMGAAEGVDTYRYQFQPGRRYKPFLHHITKGKEVRTRLLKLKEPRTLPGLLTPEQVQQLIDACKRIRDKFLLCLLHQTGMRIGEVLGLRHEDMRSTGENEIHVVPRLDIAFSSLTRYSSSSE